MTKLPNFENAFIDNTKLIKYCLNENHPIGKHKARLFQSYLSITSSDALKLKGLILKSLSESDAILGKLDKYGQRFTVELKISNFDKTATVITAWIINNGENFPRLISCFIKK